MMLVGQTMVGGVVSTTVTTWWQVSVLPQLSWMSQLLVMYFGQVPLVTMLVELMNIFPPQQEEAVGVSNVQLVPHGTVLFVGQKTWSKDVQLVTSARKAVGEKPGTPVEPLLVK